MSTTDPVEYSFISSVVEGDMSYSDDFNVTMSGTTSVVDMMMNITTTAAAHDPILDTNGGAPYEEPATWYRILLLGGYLIIIIVGLPANALVLAVTLFCNSSNSAQNTINTYITNLASADLLYTFGAIFWAWTNYDKEWKFGDLGCRLVYTELDFLTIHVSAYTLTVMTIERYLVIMYPMKSLRCRNISVARNISIIVWVTAFILVLPAIILTKAVPYNIHGKIKYVCDFTLGLDSFDRYYIAIFVITFAIPTVLMVVVYIKMFNRIFGTIHDSDDSNQQITVQLRSSSRRAAKIVFLIGSLWLLSFIPYWLHSFLYKFLPPNVPYDTNNLFSTIAQLLTYVNSMVNPFLYTLLPKRYNVWKRLRSKPPPYEAPVLLEKTPSAATPN